MVTIRMVMTMLIIIVSMTLEEKKGERKGKTPAKRELQGGQVCTACGSSTHKRSSHRDCPLSK